MRDYKQYTEAVRDRFSTLQGAAAVCVFDINKTHVGSSVTGKIVFHTGFEFEIEEERFVFVSHKRKEQRSYRYWIRKDGMPLIRFETAPDPRYPPHAHVYGGPLPDKEKEHVDEDKWPEEIRRPDSLKMYDFFQRVIALEGALPPPFGEGGLELTR